MANIRLKALLKEEKKEQVSESRFNEREYKKLIDEGFEKLYDGINRFEKEIPRYMEKTQQGGIVGTYEKQYGKQIKNVLKAIEDLERVIDK